MQNRGGSLMDFLSAEQPNLVVANPGASRSPLSTAHLPPNPQDPAAGAPAVVQDDPLAPGWIPNRRPMYLGVSSVPLPGQRQPTAVDTAAAFRGGTGEEAAMGVPQEAGPRGQELGGATAGMPPYPPFPGGPEAAAAATAAAATYQRMFSTPFAGTALIQWSARVCVRGPLMLQGRCRGCLDEEGCIGGMCAVVNMHEEAA